MNHIKQLNNIIFLFLVIYMMASLVACFPCENEPDDPGVAENT